MNSQFVIEFGEAVREAREAAEMSQEDLADRAGLHRTHVSLIERAKRQVQLNTVEAICRALKVQPGDLMPKLDFPQTKRLKLRSKR